MSFGYYYNGKAYKNVDDLAKASDTTPWIALRKAQAGVDMELLTKDTAIKKGIYVGVPTIYRINDRLFATVMEISDYLGVPLYKAQTLVKKGTSVRKLKTGASVKTAKWGFSE